MAVTRLLRLAAPLLGVSLAFSASAQQSPGSDRSAGPPGGMSGMDMQATMSRCAEMRQQMRQGAAMSSDMQNMMAQCDEMDRQMGGAATTAPHTRTR